MKNTRALDLLILGGGPAGMTAAIYAARGNLRCAIIETAVTGGLVNSTYTVENFPSYPSIHGMELMERMRAHADCLGVEVEEASMIEGLDIAGPEKLVETEETIYTGKAIIIATGRKPIELGIEVPCDNVHYCAICDGAPYKGKRVLVAGGGNSAFDESLYLLGLGVAHLTVIEVMDRFFAAERTREALLSRPNVTGLVSTRVADLVTEGGALSAVVLENVARGEKTTIPADGVFVFLGQKPANECFRDAVAVDEQGYVMAGEDMSTNVPGVFSAGDINRKRFRQITTAMSDGTIAALAAERYIRSRP